MFKARRLAAFAAVGVLGVAGPASFVDAQEAPPGSATAVALEIKDILAIAKTDVEATGRGGTATANALEIGGAPLAEQTGGTQQGVGESHSALIDTGDTPLGRLQVTPWKAEVKNTEACREAYGEAALARLTLIDEQTLDVDVLQSSSRAQHCGLRSEGAGSSDGAVVNLGDGALSIILLHSDVATGAEGHSYAIGLNGQTLISDADAGGACNVELPGLLALGCLMVGGGEGGLVDATFASLDVGDGALLGTVVGGSASPGAAAVPEAPAPAPAELPTQGPDTDTLPRTGGPGGLLLLGGAAIAAALATRRRAATA